MSLRLTQTDGNRPPYSESEASRVLVQLVESVAHCHALGIVHRDLKPENVMQAVGSASDQPLLKLCDFGQAAMISGGEGRRLRRKCGTEQYMAPEVLDAELGGALGCERTQAPATFEGAAVPLLLVRPSSPV